MKKQEIKEFMERSDLLWQEGYYTISKYTFEKEIMQEIEYENNN